MDRVAVTFGDGGASQLSPKFTINSSTLDFDQRPKRAQPNGRFASGREAVPHDVIATGFHLFVGEIFVSALRRPQAL